MPENKRDPVSGIEYQIPTPAEAKRLREEGRSLRRALEKQLAPMSGPGPCSCAECRPDVVAMRQLVKTERDRLRAFVAEMRESCRYTGHDRNTKEELAKLDADLEAL